MLARINGPYYQAGADSNGRMTLGIPMLEQGFTIDRLDHEPDTQRQSNFHTRSGTKLRLRLSGNGTKR